MNAVPIEEAGPVRRDRVGQLCAFAAIGIVSTAAYSLLFWLLRPLAPTALASTAALLLTAVANTAANRRFTFGVRGRDGLAADHASGLLTLTLALATTNVAVAGLLAVRPAASPATELAALTAANALATVLRFTVLRALIVGRRRPRTATIGTSTGRA